MLEVARQLLLIRQTEKVVEQAAILPNTSTVSNAAAIPASIVTESGKHLTFAIRKKSNKKK
jgi:hypothetical protein